MKTLSLCLAAAAAVRAAVLYPLGLAGSSIEVSDDMVGLWGAYRLGSDAELAFPPNHKDLVDAINRAPRTHDRAVVLVSTEVDAALAVPVLTALTFDTSLPLSKLALADFDATALAAQVSVVEPAELSAIVAKATGYDVTVVLVEEALAQDSLPQDVHFAHVEKRSPKNVAGPHTLGKRLLVKGFASAEECAAGTNSCNGHGSCVGKKGAYLCVCVPTYDKAKRQTTVWAGAACEKIDVSTQFSLFLWTGVALVVFGASGVGLLYGIGTEPLPGVLDAATAGKA